MIAAAATGKATLMDEEDLATVTAGALMETALTSGTLTGTETGVATTVTVGAGTALMTMGAAFSIVFTASTSTVKSSFIGGSESPNSSSSKAAYIVIQRKEIEHDGKGVA